MSAARPEDSKVLRYAWQANKQGGRRIGGFEEIRPWNRATAARGEMHAQRLYQPEHENKGWYASLISEDGITWELFRVRQLDDLIPEQYKFDRGWVIEVRHFFEPRAQRHIRTFDDPSDPPVQLAFDFDAAIECEAASLGAPLISGARFTERVVAEVQSEPAS